MRIRHRSAPYRIRRNSTSVSGPSNVIIVSPWDHLYMRILYNGTGMAWCRAREVRDLLCHRQAIASHITALQSGPRRNTRRARRSRTAETEDSGHLCATQTLSSRRQDFIQNVAGNASDMISKVMIAPRTNAKSRRPRMPHAPHVPIVPMSAHTTPQRRNMCRSHPTLKGSPLVG